MEATNDELIQLFENHIVEAAKEVAEKEVTSKPDWFTASEDTLIKLIHIRNEALKNFMEKGTAETQENLRETRRNLLREKRKAKRKWQFNFAENCQKKDFRSNPKEAWQMVFRLMDGFQKHHRKATQKLFKNQKGKVAINPKDYRNVESHWNTVFNRHATDDENIVDEIQQLPVQYSLGIVPKKSEIKKL